MKAEIFVCFCLMISHNKLNSFVDTAVAKLTKQKTVEATNKLLSEVTTSSDLELMSNHSEKTTDGMTLDFVENSTSNSSSGSAEKNVTVSAVKVTSQFIPQLLTKSTAELTTPIHDEITTQTSEIILEHITTERLTNATIESVLNYTTNKKDDDHKNEVVHDHDDHMNEILHDHGDHKNEILHDHGDHKNETLHDHGDHNNKILHDHADHKNESLHDHGDHNNKILHDHADHKNESMHDHGDHNNKILHDHADHKNESLHDHDKTIKTNNSIPEVKINIKKQNTEAKKEPKTQSNMKTDKLKYKMFIPKKEFEMKPKKQTDHNNTNEVPECFMLLANITKANEAKELDVGTEIPVCNADGSFTAKQCSPAGYCRCVSKNGTSITEAKQGDLFCDCLRQRHDYWSFSRTPSHIPECDEHGYFKPKQCMDNSTICWCSTKDGNILTEPFEDVVDCDETKMVEIKDRKNVTMTDRNETSYHK